MIKSSITKFQTPNKLQSPIVNNQTISKIKSPLVNWLFIGYWYLVIGYLTMSFWIQFKEEIVNALWEKEEIKEG
jgi:hypothetical protein